MIILINIRVIVSRGDWLEISFNMTARSYIGVNCNECGEKMQRNVYWSIILRDGIIGYSSF